MMDRCLRDDYWHLLCHRTELPKNGDFMRLRWLGDDVVVANDDGELIVFDNICPHRGARFFSTDVGNSPISCPYHGWTFCAGKLYIPCINKFNTEEISRSKIGTLQTAWCGDFLFAAITPLQSIENQLSSFYEIVASISMDISGRHDWNAYTYECDWKIAVENALDSLHIRFVHAESLARLQLEDERNQFVGNNTGVTFEIGNLQMYKRLNAMSRMFNVTEQFKGYMNIYLFPFSMLSSTFGYSYSLQSFFPAKEPGKTQFYSRLLKGVLRPGVDASAMQHFFDSTAQVNRMVFEEDHAVCRQIDDTRYDWHDLSRLSSDEEKIAHFRRSLQSVTSR